MEKVPIFILKLVVFPNSYYPLHIFEERYKKMIRNCLEHDKEFGIIESPLDAENQVGSLVKIENVTKLYDNGEMDVVVKGIERFHVKDIILSEHEYYEAIISTFTDNSEYAQPFLVSRVVLQFKELLTAIKYEIGESFWNNFEATNLKSFKLAEKTGLHFEEQKILLAMQEEEKRLTFLLQHLNKLKKYLNDKAKIDSIVKNNGYLN
ncbi:MAG TPA: LON peptidase substrate-binding domain-containing protein [Ignavibacteriaceae bacterium]|nr:LON peptidase substrate-binding domain-containing protein [Ignavibacteriaceae bacterium]